MADKKMVQEEARAAFIEQVTKADGKLIPLSGRKSKLGEPFFISTRLGQDEISPELGYLNVDIFVQRGEEFVPIAIYDWEITKNEALGNKQRHQHLPCLNQAQRNADRYWSTGEAFHVRDDDFLKFAMENGGFEKMDQLRRQGVIQSEDQWTKSIYQGQGLGSFIITVSALALHKHGIETMKLGSLNKKAKLAWKGFGQGDRLNIKTAELVSHPKVADSINRFIA